MRRFLALVIAGLVLPTVALAGGQAMSPVVSAKLKGSNETPVKGDPNGAGFVVVTFNANKGTACWKFKGVKGVAAPNAAHIHKGKKGTSGPVTIAFGATYKASGCAKAPKATIEKIETNPNAYYVNVHNAKYPAGALRGQLVAGMEG
ncbi:MAG: CHRD domain-containing protein [Gaiellaceae bacterium]